MLASVDLLPLRITWVRTRRLGVAELLATAMQNPMTITKLGDMINRVERVSNTKKNDMEKVR